MSQEGQTGGCARTTLLRGREKKQPIEHIRVRSLFCEHLLKVLRGKNMSNFALKTLFSYTVSQCLFFAFGLSAGRVSLESSSQTKIIL